MSILESIMLGLIQGITEFLPISSSAHLIIARNFLNLPLQNTLEFDVLLHLATLLVIIFYFWGDIRRIFIDAKTEGLSSRSSRLLGALILGTIPAVLVGFFFGDFLETTFRNPRSVALALILGSVLFFLADRLGKGKGGLTLFKGFVIGIFQSLALISGFSRSGSTIAGGLLSGLSREEAIRFAFLLAIPIVFGATLKTFLDPSFLASNLILNTSSLLGFAAALFSGLFSIRFLVRYLSQNSFTPFIIYRLLLAATILIFL